jgi:hypothetical protein
MGGIFINYRSGGHTAVVHGLHERLASHFGDATVFLDKPSLHVGDRYPDVIRRRLMNADVLIAMIHGNWLDERNADGVRLLDRDRDWVREELELAFTMNKKIVPLLIDETSLPAAADLPPSVGDLAHRQARRVHSDALSSDSRALIEELERDVAPTWSPRTTTPTQQQPIVRPFSPVPVVLMLVLLVTPTLLTINQRPSSNHVPMSAYIALCLTLVMLIRLVASLLIFPIRPGINTMERVTHPMSPIRYYNIFARPMGILIQGFTGAIAILGALSLHFPKIVVYAVSATAVLLFVFGISYSVVLVSRQEHADEQRARHWPEPLPFPPDPVILRREVWRLDGQLDAWSAPLSREQSDKAHWAVNAIRENATQIRHRALRSRHSWLMADQPAKLVRYLVWTTAIVGLLAAAILPRVLNHLVSPGRASFTIVGGAVVTSLIAAAILELDYQQQRWRARNVTADVTGDAERLSRRLDELLQPPSWEALDE